MPLELGPVVMPLGLLGSLVTQAISWGRSAHRTESVEEAVRALVADTKDWRARTESRIHELESALAELRLSLGTRVTALEAHLGNISQTMGRIEGKLDRGQR